MSENKEKERGEKTNRGCDPKKDTEKLKDFIKKQDEFERQSREKEIMVKLPR